MADSINTLRISITKRYGGKTVLDRFPLEIHGREFVTFLGPSGCGKSTALGIIAGLVPATEGEIWHDDQRIDNVLPEKRGFGMVFQNYALFPHLTVFDNVAFGLSLQRRPPAEIKQRARALVLHPRLMLFDEPLSNLDAKLRVEMRAEIKQLHTRLGLTSIYVTHDQAEALSLSDRIVVLREGMLMQVGTPQEIHDRPKNVFVADFMGFRNFFDIELGQANGGFVEGVSKGLKLRARATDDFLGPAVMAIRPEDIRVGKSADDVNEIRGKVELVEYLGREQEFAVSTEDGQRIWLRSAHKVALGDNIELTLPVEKLILLPRD